MMTRVLVLFVGLAVASVAQAQIKCWTGANGKRACGDLPPPGVRLETPKGAPMPQEPAPATTDAKKEPSASAPLGQEIRRPQAESQRAAAKVSLERANVVKAQECERGQEMLREMGGGGRSKRTVAFKARRLAEQNCG
jgi:hypothetical protein